jgi:hypothetical protein
VSPRRKIQRGRGGAAELEDLLVPPLELVLHRRRCFPQLGRSEMGGDARCSSRRGGWEHGGEEVKEKSLVTYG